MKDKVSVVIPSYNREQFILGTVDSVCLSTYRPLEILIVDDGSTDQTLSLEAQIQARCLDAGVQCQFISQKNGGACKARNRGLALATGDLILFLDSDDKLYPDALSTLADRLNQSHDLDVTYGLVDIVEEKSGATIGTMGKAPSQTEQDLIDYLWHTMAALYRKAVIRDITDWNTALTLGDDWEFSSKIRIAGARYEFLPIAVGAYYKHEGPSLTTDSFKFEQCQSVIDAAYSIYQFSEIKGQDSPAIRQRCWNRIFVQSLELSINNSQDAATKGFGRCIEIGSPSLLLRFIFLSTQCLPFTSLRKRLYKYIRK